MKRELHLISNGKQPLQQFAELAGKAHRWVAAFHLREKSAGASEIMRGIELMLQAGVPAAKIFVNDRVDAAWSARVGGVQLAWHSLDVPLVKRNFPGLKVGRSVHALDEAMEMERSGADFIIFGHIFPTASKPDTPPRGLAALQRVASAVRIPVIAIGGISPDNAAQVIRAGAAGVAVMSGILEADDQLAAVKAYDEAINENGGIGSEQPL